MRGQHHLRRAGMVSAGTLVLVLTSTASPAAADEQDSGCKDGEGLLSTVTDVVCDTTGTVTDTTDDLTDTTAEVLDDTTGGATEDVTDGVKDSVKDVTDGVTDTVRDTTGQRSRDDGDPSGSSSGPDGSVGQSGNDGSGSGGSSDPGGDGAGGEQGDGGDSGESEVGAAGSSTDTSAAAGGGRPPRLQPLSPLAGLQSMSSTDDVGTAPQPELPEIAPSPTPSPEPNTPAPEATQYVAPAGDDASDRGEATPALMVIFAITAAGIVTGGHIAVARARLRSRRVA